jgi:hypothetical protein
MQGEAINVVFLLFLSIIAVFVSTGYAGLAGGMGKAVGTVKATPISWKIPRKIDPYIASYYPQKPTTAR